MKNLQKRTIAIFACVAMAVALGATSLVTGMMHLTSKANTDTPVTHSVNLQLRTALNRVVGDCFGFKYKEYNSYNGIQDRQGTNTNGYIGYKTNYTAVEDTTFEIWFNLYNFYEQTITCADCTAGKVDAP